MGEVSVSPSAKLLDLKVGINNYRRRSVAAEHDAIRGLEKLTGGGHIDAGWRRFNERFPSRVGFESELGRRDVFLRVNFVLLVHQLKQILESAHGFSRTEHEQP